MTASVNVAMLAREVAEDVPYNPDRADIRDCVIAVFGPVIDQLQARALKAEDELWDIRLRGVMANVKGLDRTVGKD